MRLKGGNMDRDVLIQIINGFATAGKVFSNEQDFQFEFALALKERNEVEEVKLEVLSFPNKIANRNDFIGADGSLDLNIIEESEDEENKEEGDDDGNKQSKKTKIKKEYTDIIVKTTDGKYYAIELKFKGADKAYLYNSKEGNVAVMAHGAVDINAYYFLKDIVRLEDINNRVFPKDITIKNNQIQIGNQFKIEKGFAILLTNNIKYKTSNFPRARVWKDFPICHGREINVDNMQNKKYEVHSSTKENAKYVSLKPKGKYKLEWKDYDLNVSPVFSFLVVEVDSKKLGQNVETPSSN